MWIMWKIFYNIDTKIINLKLYDEIIDEREAHE
jgi:hypothetical protein